MKKSTDYQVGEVLHLGDLSFKKQCARTPAAGLYNDEIWTDINGADLTPSLAFEQGTIDLNAAGLDWTLVFEPVA